VRSTQPRLPPRPDHGSPTARATPGRPAVIERSAVRLVVLDTQDRVLLFHTHDVDHPDLGSWWELPGGGIDPGETYLDAAIRELHEETGILADPSQVGNQPGAGEPRFDTGNSGTCKAR
jgi:8-oxo-dGTP pyrophosphatase MutT (NUDIX family)